jgi:hypothetical protein
LPLNIGPQTTSSQPPLVGLIRNTRGSLGERPDGPARHLRKTAMLPLRAAA